MVTQGCAAHRRPGIEPSLRSSGKIMGTTVESRDPALAAALLNVGLVASAAHHRAAADEYLRLGILDTAFDHLTAATRIDPRDAAAYDIRARIWRDWGFSDLGMADAARAVYYAPHSAAAHNTRGTLLVATGQIDDARREFEIALSLDPEASFARENLRYLDATHFEALAQGQRKQTRRIPAPASGPARRKPQ
jgi:tetratricopeptide (TPR) repeat protein